MKPYFDIAPMFELMKTARGIPALPECYLDQIPVKYLDIPYASASEDQKIDIYLPIEPSDKLVPVVCWIHGGGFSMGFKRDGSLFDLLPVLLRGYALVSIGYRKSGEARFPASVYDAKAAIRHIRANADKYGLDGSRVAVWGGSAGGWLASFLAATNGNPAFEDLSMDNPEVSSDVQVLIDWCGPNADFNEMNKQLKALGPKPEHKGPKGSGGPSGGPGGPGKPRLSPESAFMGAPVETIPELVRLAAPTTHVSEKMVPTFIAHGDKDFTVPLAQSEVFYQAIVDKVGADQVQMYVHPGGGHHGDLWYHSPELFEMCISFLDKYLR